MVRNGKFGCCRCVLHHFWMCYDLYIKFYHNINFHHFSLFCLWIFSFWHSKCWRGVLQDEFLIIFWVKHDHISSRFNMWPLTRIILFPTLIFVILSQISKSCMWAKFGEEFLRWVIMIRKVLSSKSIKSQLFNALSHVSYSPLVAEISSFEVQKYPQ